MALIRPALCDNALVADIETAATEDTDDLFAWWLGQSGFLVVWRGRRQLRGHAIDVAFLPINGRAPERRVAGNLSGDGAAQLAADAGVDVAVPCHYEMFEFNIAPPDGFVAGCDRLGIGHRVPRCGERVRLPRRGL